MTVHHQIKTVCDRCGHQVETKPEPGDDTHLKGWGLISNVSLEFNERSTNFLDQDLCPECSESFLKWWKQELN